MDVIDAIKTGGASVHICDKDIADDVINNILECGRLALAKPSALGFLCC